MVEREKVTYGLRCMCYGDVECKECPYARNGSGWHDCRSNCAKDTLALLKEQEEQVKQWTKEIAENQIAHAPNDYPMSLDEQLENEYKRGIWDGLQIAWNIISEGR